MGPYRRFQALAVCLVSAFFVVGALVAPTSAADEPTDLNALVGKWVWHQTAACAACKPFTIVLNILSVSADGKMEGTYESSGFVTPGARPVKPRATVTDGKVKVEFKFRTFGFDLNYQKRSDTLEGPVSGFAQFIRDAEFQREK